MNKMIRVLKKLLKILVVIGAVLMIIAGFYNYTIKCLNLGNTNKIRSIVDSSKNRCLLIEGFITDMKVTYISNGLKTEYEMEYILTEDENNNKVETLTYKKPEKFNGMQIICSKESIKHLNPYITKNLIYYSDNTRNYNEVLLTSFKRNYFLNNSSKMQEDSTNIILETKIPEENFYFKYEKLIIDKTTMMPVKLSILNDEKKEICIIDYTNFREYNKKENSKADNVSVVSENEEAREVSKTIISDETESDMNEFIEYDFENNYLLKK